MTIAIHIPFWVWPFLAGLVMGAGGTFIAGFLVLENGMHRALSNL